MKNLGLVLVCLLLSFSAFSQWQESGLTLQNTTTGSVDIGSFNGSSDASLQIGNARSADGHAYFDLVSDNSSYSGFGSRLIRFGKGPLSGVTRFEHRGSQPLEFKASDNGEVKFLRQGNALSMTIKPDGKIGIGTSDPGSFALAVDGNIGSREVQVTATSPFPDYVFAENYYLTPLEELDSYIKENNHLPNIPSAADVEKNGGFELGSMSIKLLEKVEELTLYIISQEKRIKSLENQLQD